MCARIIFFLTAVLFVAPGAAQQSTTTEPELELNLEQFPDTGDDGKELELNLEQFDQQDTQTNSTDNGSSLNLEQFDSNTGEQKSTDSDDGNLKLDLDQFDKNTDESNKELELNLDQFDKSNSGTKQIGNQDSSAVTEAGQSGKPKYKYLRVFIIGGIALLVFMYLLSRRRRRRR